VSTKAGQLQIDANRPGIYRWLITLGSRTVRSGVAPDREEAAAAVSDALDELSG
jgi:molybdopterin biosynthesis enzyme